MSDVEVVGGSGVEVFGADAVRLETAAWLLRYSSERTRTEYARRLERFKDFARSIQLHRVEDVERVHLDTWARVLEQSLAPASVRTMLAAVSSWFDALNDAGLVRGNPCAAVRRPKVDNKVGSTPAADAADVAALYDAARELGPDAHVLIGLLVELGVRISQACTVKAENVLQLPGGHVGVRMIRKGGAKDDWRVSAGLGSVMLALKSERGPGDLLRSQAGMVMNRDTARNVLAAACRRAGIAEVRPHQIRTWAITTALGMEGVELHDVQDFARHADPAMTRRYDRARHRKDSQIGEGLLVSLAEAKRTEPEVEIVDAMAEARRIVAALTGGL
jgi:integrase